MLTGRRLLRRPGILVAFCWVVGSAASAQVPSPQPPPPPLPPAGPALLRFEAGLLDPDSPAKGVGAIGATVGWSPGPSTPNALLVRYVRQLRNRTASIYVYDHSREFLLVQWEHSFGIGTRLRRQFSGRVGLGALLTYHAPAALVLGGGLAVRYPVGPRLALAGSVEDNVAVLPHHDGIGCYGAGGQTYCSRPPTGGWQHNFGVLAGVEWRPPTHEFRQEAAPPAPASDVSEAPAGTTETPVGAVCSHLGATRGALVRVRTYARRDTSLALLIHRGSEVRPLLRCEGGAVVLGPTLGQSAPELTILEPWIHEAWIRGNQGLRGALVGVGSGALIGVLLGSAKSSLCNGQPCASHELSSTLIGAVAGGAIGWLIGGATPRWVHRYP